MKKLGKAFLACLLTMLLTTTFTTAVAVEENNRTSEKEKAVLEEYQIKSNVKKVGDNQYSVKYGRTTERVEIEQKTNTITVTDGTITNTLWKDSEGDLYVDGKKIVINETSGEELRGTIYKGTKSLKPYGTLKSSDYKKFAGTRTANLELGKAIDQLTATALANIIAYCHGYLGIAVTLGTSAKQIKDVVVAKKPKTKYLGYKCQTYIHSYTDYKYKNMFYAEASFQTLCKTTYSYEHFVVY